MIGKVHAYGYLNLPLFYDPVAACGADHPRRHQPAGDGREGPADLGADVAATDYRAVTENPAIDIVHICTPNHLHKEALLSAMRHQKHIYCDKPLVATHGRGRGNRGGPGRLPRHRADDLSEPLLSRRRCGRSNWSSGGCWARSSDSASAICTAATPIPTHR